MLAPQAAEQTSTLAIRRRVGRWRGCSWLPATTKEARRNRVAHLVAKTLHQACARANYFRESCYRALYTVFQ